MGKDKKTQAGWTVFLQGSVAALGVYLSGAFLTALLLVKGILPERAMFSVVAGLCVAASLIGGVMIGGRTALGRLSASALNAAIFSLILMLVGTVCWYEISWSGHGGLLVMCALVGGILAGVLVKPKGKRKRRGKSRVARKQRVL